MSPVRMRKFTSHTYDQHYGDKVLIGLDEVTNWL